MFLLKETLPSKVARKYSRLQQIDEEQGVPPEAAHTDNKGLPVTCCMTLICCVTLAGQYLALWVALWYCVWVKLWLTMQELAMLADTDLDAVVLQCVCAVSHLHSAASVCACAFGALAQLSLLSHPGCTHRKCRRCCSVPPSCSAGKPHVFVFFCFFVL